MAQIGTLSVKFESSAKALESALASLTSQLNKFQAATKSTSLVRVANETKQLGVAAEKAAKKTNGFGSSLMRIAKYRILRSILRGITQAFREGVTNLYEYSTALNSADAAANKSTMDQYASSLLYLKNAAGAASGPLLQALLPVVQQLVDWFVAGANAVNQFISALQGKTTFTKAVYNMKEFGDQTKKAGAAAKELKKTIFGWDELNILQDNKPSGGGGAAASTPDYSGMFEEAEIGTGFQKVADFIKDNFGWFFDAVEWLWDNKIIQGIGAAFLAWKITKSVISFFNMLLIKPIAKIVAGISSAFKGVSTALGATGLTGVLSVLGVELGLAAYGFGLMYNAYEEGRRIFENSEAYQNLQNIAKKIATNMESARSRTDAFQQVVNKWNEKFAKIEYAKTLIDGIFEIYNKSTKTKDEISKMQSMISELNGLKLEGLKITYDSATGKILETEGAIRSVIKAIEDQAKTTALQELLVEAYKLQFGLTSDLEGANAAEGEAFRAYMEAVAKYDDYVNSHTGGNLSFWDSVMYGAAGGYESAETFTATDKKAQALAQEVDAAFEVWQAAKKGTTTIAEQLDDATAAVERLKKANLAGVLDGSYKSATDLGNGVKTAQENVTKLRVASEKLGGVKVDLYDDELKELGAAANTAATKVNTLHTNMKKLVDMRKGEGGASGITKEVSDNLKNARDYSKTLYTNLTNIEGITMTTFVDKLIEARDALYNAKVYAYNLYDNLNKASKYKLRKMDEYALNKAYVEYDPTFTYASGGWPSAGELFVAREAGPEMVGTINGSTAVATNGDIVAAVSQGVAQAVAGVMGSGSGDMNISIQVGEYELANAVVSALNAQTRRIGYSQLEGI